MKDFINLIAPYKELIVSSLCVVVAVIGLFIKRRPKSIDDFYLLVTELITCLPKLINQVEEPGHGVTKKAKVINLATGILEKKLGRSLSTSERDYFDKSVDKAIELILSTPHKKVVNL